MKAKYSIEKKAWCVEHGNARFYLTKSAFKKMLRKFRFVIEIDYEEIDATSTKSFRSKPGAARRTWCWTEELGEHLKKLAPLAPYANGQ